MYVQKSGWWRVSYSYPVNPFEIKYKQIVSFLSRGNDSNNVKQTGDIRKNFDKNIFIEN